MAELHTQKETQETQEKETQKKEKKVLTTEEKLKDPFLLFLQSELRETEILKKESTELLDHLEKKHCDLLMQILHLRVQEMKLKEQRVKIEKSDEELTSMLSCLSLQIKERINTLNE